MNSIMKNLLLEVKKTDISFEQILYDSSWKNVDEVIEYVGLLEIDVNWDKGNLLLEASSSDERLPILEIFLKMNPRMKYLQSCLREAAHKGNLRIVEALVKVGADPKELESCTAYNNYSYIRDYFEGLKEK